jgi:hypothetical protein
LDIVKDMKKKISKSGLIDDLVDHVSTTGNCILFRRVKKCPVAMIPVPDAAFLKKIEDEIDRRAIMKARKERHKAVPLEKIREKYGL